MGLRTRSVIRLLVVVVLAGAALGITRGAAAQAVDVTDYEGTMLRMVRDFIDAARTDGRDRTVFDAVANSGDPLYIAPLLDMGYFSRSFTLSDQNDAIFYGLGLLSGQDFGPDWRAYFEWAGQNDIALPPGYAVFKGELLGQLIDRRFRDFLNADVQDTAAVNLVEVVWGGVRVDGIPSLVNARQITPERATLEGATYPEFCRDEDCRYPAPDEFVFGVSLNGVSRAYPLRLLNWHEMFNDVLGSTPLYAAPGDAEPVCDFLAPVEFRTTARSGDDWVEIHGLSTECPTTGWIAVEAVDWRGDSWEAVRERLPNLAEAGTARLDRTDGVIGRVSGTPVMLAYCTLCGAGILYNPVIEDLERDGDSLGRTVLEFGSTGMLMRSNKLMYDRLTNTVWNALTGTPAFGPLAGSGLTLERLPVVVTDWATWLEEHPETTVLSLDTGFPRNYTNGAAYAEYFNDPDFIMFPVWQQDTAEQENKEVVFTLLLDGTPKAYPLRHLIPERVVNDVLNDQSVVLIARQNPERDFFEPGGATVRAYERGEHTFTPGDVFRELIDEAGAVWTQEEEGLIGPNGEVLPRLPGHLAFWFGWYSFYPDTLVYMPDGA